MVLIGSAFSLRSNSGLSFLASISRRFISLKQAPLRRRSLIHADSGRRSNSTDPSSSDVKKRFKKLQEKLDKIFSEIEKEKVPKNKNEKRNKKRLIKSRKEKIGKTLRLEPKESKTEIDNNSSENNFNSKIQKPDLKTEAKYKSRLKKMKESNERKQDFSLSFKNANAAPFLDEKSNFSNFIRSQRLLKNLEKNRFKVPSIIQNKAAHLIFNPNQDENAKRTTVIAAETGCGKTIAFLAPILDKLLSSMETAETEDFGVSEKSQNYGQINPKAIIIAPSDELCSQIKSVGEVLLEKMPLSIRHYEHLSEVPQVTHPLSRHLLSYSANNLKKTDSKKKNERNSLIQKEDAPGLMVCTPSLLSSYLRTKPDVLLSLDYIVFDEADLMLSLSKGYWKSFKRILQVFGRLRKDLLHAPSDSPLHSLPKTHIVFCGATLGKPSIRKFLQRGGTPSNFSAGRLNSLFKLFEGVNWVESRRLHRVLPIEADWILVRNEKEHNKALLAALISDNTSQTRLNIKSKNLESFAKEKNKESQSEPKKKEKAIVFCSFIENAIRINTFLKSLGFRSVCIHERMSNIVRKGNLFNFQSADKFDILVCTDLMSRGIDFCDVGHVVMYDFAKNVTEYLHRTGRTARAGKGGRVTNLFVPRDEPVVRAIRNGSGDLSGEFSWSCRRKKSVGKNKKREYGGRIKPNPKTKQSAAWWKRIKTF